MRRSSGTASKIRSMRRFSVRVSSRRATASSWQADRLYFRSCAGTSLGNTRGTKSIGSTVSPRHLRNIQPRYNICPTTTLDVVIRGNGQRSPFTEGSNAVTDDQLREWASKASSEIVKREGAALALSVSDRDETAIEADSNLLGIAIAQAIIEAYRAGITAASLRTL